MPILLNTEKLPKNSFTADSIAKDTKDNNKSEIKRMIIASSLLWHRFPLINDTLLVLYSTFPIKAIYYMRGLKEGSIIFCDDVDLSDTLEGVIKRSTSSFQTGSTHVTLDIKRNDEAKKIPPRISWWLTSVDDDQSLQLLNRQFGGGVDESEART